MAEDSSAHVGRRVLDNKIGLTSLVDIVASKAAALVIHFGLLVPLLRADHWM